MAMVTPLYWILHLVLIALIDRNHFLRSPLALADFLLLALAYPFVTIWWFNLFYVTATIANDSELDLYEDIAGATTVGVTFVTVLSLWINLSGVILASAWID